MQIQGRQWLVAGSIFSFAVAILHIAIIFGGAPAYRYFGAGEEMAQMASSGSVLPALATLLIAVIFALWGLYALSGAGVIRHLPLLRTGLVFIASIYTLRGIGIILYVNRRALERPPVVTRRETHEGNTSLRGQDPSKT